MINTSTQQIESLAKEIFIESVQEGRKPFLKYKGQSMIPLLKEGDEVFFEKDESIKFGDLVVYRDNSHFIVHRFILRKRIGKKEFFILKADNFFKFDEPVSQEEIVGKVTKIKRGDKVLSLATFKGRLKNLLYFSISYPRVILRQFIYKNDNFQRERKVLGLILKDGRRPEENQELADLLNKNLSWKYLIDKIKGNFYSYFCLESLTYSGLKDLIPSDFLSQLEEARRFQLAQDARSRHILEPALREFSNKRVDILFIKGFSAGLELYKDTAYRWMGDIDLVVKLKDWPKATGILSDYGFRRLSRGQNLNNWALKYLDNHISFYKNGVRIELKPNIWPIDFPYFNYDCWQDARPVRIGGSQAYFPSPENMLLFACINLARHKFTGLIWFRDVKEIVDKFRQLLNWEKFLNLAKSSDLSTLVYYSLDLTSKLMKLKLPEGVLPKIKPNFIRMKLFEFFWDTQAILLKKEGRTFRAKIPFEFILVLFCGKVNLSPKKLIIYIKYLLRIIFPPPYYIKEKFKLKNSGLALIKAYFLRLSLFFLRSAAIFNLILRRV